MRVKAGTRNTVLSQQAVFKTLVHKGNGAIENIHFKGLVIAGRLNETYLPLSKAGELEFFVHGSRMAILRESGTDAYESVTELKIDEQGFLVRNGARVRDGKGLVQLGSDKTMADEKRIVDLAVLFPEIALPGMNEVDRQRRSDNPPQKPAALIISTLTLELALNVMNRLKADSGNFNSLLWVDGYNYDDLDDIVRYDDGSYSALREISRTAGDYFRKPEISPEITRKVFYLLANGLKRLRLDNSLDHKSKLSIAKELVLPIAEAKDRAELRRAKEGLQAFIDTAAANFRAIALNDRRGVRK
jgi:hypothetical protein